VEVTTEQVKALRDACGAGIMECRNTLKDTSGDFDKALAILKEKGLAKAEKKGDRATGAGLVEAYIHTAGRVGVLVEVNCETDFVARTDEFKGLCHDIAMQVAAMNPAYVEDAELPAGSEDDPAEVCLLSQPFIKDPSQTIKDLVVATIAKTGENIKVRRFARYELGC
jgi:elongation factor Ts